MHRLSDIIMIYSKCLSEVKVIAIGWTWVDLSGSTVRNRGDGIIFANQAHLGTNSLQSFVSIQIE